MLQAPFPYFGSKSNVAQTVWAALGNPGHYIEPFFGSGAVLFARPDFNSGMTETVNDKDGYLANAWRGIKFAPDEVAKWCDWPTNHIDLMARKKELIRHEDRLHARLVRDAEWHDPKIAGYWIWCISNSIGSGILSPNQIPSIAGGGSGVSRKSLTSEEIYKIFNQLSKRLRKVRVVCGDWTRICGGNWQDKVGQIAGMFFDPPYGVEDRATVYKCDNLGSISKEVEKYVLKRGAQKTFRIVVAGYDTEYPSLKDAGWTLMPWKTSGGWSNIATVNKDETRGKVNKHRETLFFSPHCIKKPMLTNSLLG